MNDTKPWYKSLTVWALLLAVAVVLGCAIARKFGVQFDATEKGVVDTVTLALLALAGYGRVNATKQIEPANDDVDPSHFRPTVLLCLAATVVLAVAGGGCGSSRADVARTRETLYLGTRTMRAEHLQWARQMGPGGDLTKLPTLTASDVALRERWDKEVEDYVTDSRTHDADGGILGPLARP